MDIAALQAKVADTFIIHRGERLNFSYRPDMYTDAIHRQWGSWEITKDFAEGNGIMQKLLVRWDLTDGGVQIPINEESLSQVPVSVKLAMLKSIMEDVLSGKSSGNSFGTSMVTNGVAPSSIGSFA